MGDPGGWKAAAEIPETAGGAADVLSLIRADLNIGDAAIRWGFYTEARRRLGRAVELASKCGYLRIRDMAEVTLAHLDWYTGHWHGLAERTAKLAAIEEEPLIGLDSVLVTALLTSATSTDPGELSLAGEQFGQVMTDAARRGFVDMPLEPTAALAAMRLAEGREADSLALTDEGMRVVTRKGIWLWATEIAPVRVQALLAAGRTAEADELITRYARGLRGCTALTGAASLAVCRAWLAEARESADRTAEHWETAAAAWDRLPRPYSALLARERRARALAAAGRDSEAAELFTRVEAGLRALGAERDARRVAARDRQETRSGRRGYGDRLSPRELAVVRLMLTGLSTPDIAKSLSRSPRTVAAQLNSAMRKHRVNSRTALAVAALRTGITPAESPPVRGA
jgi:DNA-binding CsgD family transcriptional regulator